MHLWSDQLRIKTHRCETKRERRTVRVELLMRYRRNVYIYSTTAVYQCCLLSHLVG